MNILVTGGFGNIGVVVVDECLRRGHIVSVFDVQNRRTEKLARRYGKRNVKVLFGDLRKADDVSRAVVGQDIVLHLAAILPPVSDAHPDLCKAVNVGGTANLIHALQASTKKAALVSVSSASVMGPTQKRTPPVRSDDPLSPTDAYSSSKIAAEALVAASGLRYCILRLAAVLPTVVNYSSVFAMLKLIFDMPLDARCEIVLDLDVAYALVSAAENLLGSGEIAGKKGFIAGGRAQGCQMRTRDLISLVFDPMGLRAPDESLFSPELDSYYLDWYDTEEIQSILRYQRHSAEQWQAIMIGMIRYVRPFLRLFKAGIIRWIEKQSPRYPASAGKSGQTPR
ncbi:MAG: NAD-dependent epimerase/dehydratase family protein [Anaerolineae bacterium]|nr:NAD-dependent epimerase/dehydratase family protein [Anaerolineae bacterium]